MKSPRLWPGLATLLLVVSATAAPAVAEEGAANPSSDSSLTYSSATPSDSAQDEAEEDPTPTPTMSPTSTPSPEDVVDPVTQAPTPAEPPSGPEQETSSAQTTSEAPSPVEGTGGDEESIVENEQHSDEASVVGVYRKGCVLTFKVQVNKAGTYNVEIRNDGTVVARLPVTGEADSVQNITYTMDAGSRSGSWEYHFVLVSASGEEIQDLSWNFEGTEQIMTQCTTATPSAVAGKPAVAQTPVRKGSELASTGTSTLLLGLGALGSVGLGLALRRARRGA